MLTLLLLRRTIQDAESGDAYYYTADGRTTWDRPQSSPTTEAAQSTATAASDTSDNEEVQDVMLTRKSKVTTTEQQQQQQQQQQQPQQRQRRGSLDALREQLQQAERETADKEHERAIAEVRLCV
jgi:hypothetical protein